MKKLYSTIMLSAMMIAALSLTACSKSDDVDNGSDVARDSGIIGKWFGYSCSNSDVNDLDTDHTLTLIFNEDGTGQYDEYEVIDANKCSFTYIVDGPTKGKAYISSRGTTIYFMVESGKMYVYGHGYGDDLDFVLTRP